MTEVDLHRPEIMQAVSSRIAAGQDTEYDEDDRIDYFDGEVTVDGTTYHVVCAWEDGAEGWQVEAEIDVA